MHQKQRQILATASDALVAAFVGVATASVVSKTDSVDIDSALVEIATDYVADYFTPLQIKLQFNQIDY